MKKVNSILRFSTVALILAQLALLFLPFVELDGKLYSIQTVIWTQVRDLNKLVGLPANDYGPMLGIAFAMSVLTAAFLLGSRKGLVSVGISLAWAAVVTWVYLTNPLIKMGSAGLRIAHIVLIVLADVLILARLYPWYCVRYRSQN